MPPPMILDPEKIDLNNVLFGPDEIRKFNRHRFEMEMLDAIVLYDLENKMIAGYKDFTANDFWVRGHVPGHPIVPGVLMCEAAAQITSFYIMRNKVFTSNFVGLSGFEEARFRSPVNPGDRLILCARLIRERRMVATGEVQGFVNNKMAFECTVTGVALQVNQEADGAQG